MALPAVPKRDKDGNCIHQWFVGTEGAHCLASGCHERLTAIDIWNMKCEADKQVKALEEESEKRKVAIWLLLDHVDYTENNCRINEMVSATLPVEIIVKAKEALKEEDSEYAQE